MYCNFSLQYLGLWHNIESYPSTFQPGTCNNALYEASGDVVNVYNTQVINETLDTIRGVASVVSTDGSAKLSVVFPDLTNTCKYLIISFFAREIYS